jgi:hypothetical protein
MSTELGTFGTGIGGRGNTAKLTRYALGEKDGGGVAFQITGAEGFVSFKLEALAVLFRFACYAEGRNPVRVLEESKPGEPDES